jgi:signal transduction histidine kinase
MNAASQLSFALLYVTFGTYCVPAHAAALQLGQFAANGLLQIGIAVLLIVQTALIVILMIQNYRRRRAQDDARRQQSEITHAARLVLVGEMTASIAHEVSQPLSAILSNADAAEMLLCADPPPLDEVRQILDDIRRDDLRANDIVRNLRNLLSKREMRMEIIDLNQIAQTALMLSKAAAARAGIAIQTEFDSALPRVIGDPVHLQQVMLNLIINAIDAMAEVPAAHRSLTVLTRLRDPRAAEVAVIDTGTGVESERLSKIFDSFYTTKREGMGLGLSIARAIVQTHGGNIWVENSSTRGTIFRFTIPLAAHKAPDQELAPTKRGEPSWIQRLGRLKAARSTSSTTTTASAPD